jgi:hypothetical protein
MNKAKYLSKNLTFVGFLSASVFIQSCASIPYTCEETCAMSGMVCKGQSVGQVTTGGTAFTPGGQPVFFSGGGNNISFMCEKPAGTESDAAISAAQQTAAEKAEKNRKRQEDGTWAAIIIAAFIAGATAIVISSSDSKAPYSKYGL